MNRAFTLWFTGLSGAGKTTLAVETADFLKAQGHRVQILDGDMIRQEVGNLFGYSKEERMKMSRVVRLLCRLLNQNGITVVAAVMAPYQEMREINRREIENYFEIYVQCPIEVCIQRDVKGMYKRALQGDIKHVVGIDECYEIPKTADEIIATHQGSVEESMDQIKQWLSSRVLEEGWGD